MISRDEAVARGMAAKSMLYDKARQDATQLAWLYDLAIMAPDGIAVECGVSLGGSLVCWASAREGRGLIIAVDDWSSLNPWSTGKEIFYANLERYSIPVSVLSMRACEAPALIEGEVAFCFIDACHAEEGIGSDIKVWPDKMMAGGILAFHDYDVWKPGVVVKKHVDEWQAEAEWKRLGLVGSLIAFRKPIWCWGRNELGLQGDSGEAGS